MPRRARKKESAEPPLSTITIGPDGRLYFQEVTPELLDMASVICPGNVSLQLRMAQAHGLAQDRPLEAIADQNH